MFHSNSCLDKPFRCPHPRIQFYLYTKRTQKNPELLDVLDPEHLYYTHFNRAHPTKIVIHGFGGGRNLSPSPDIRDAYFKRGDYNVIIVDYGSAVKEPCLSQMEWSPRFGSLCIAQLVKYIARHPRGKFIVNHEHKVFLFYIIYLLLYSPVTLIYRYFISLADIEAWHRTIFTLLDIVWVRI